MQKFLLENVQECHIFLEAKAIVNVAAKVVANLIDANVAKKKNYVIPNDIKVLIARINN